MEHPKIRNDFNEYDAVIDPDHNYDDFIALVKKSLGKDLLFFLIEHVTWKSLKEQGTIHAWHHAKSKIEVRSLITQYREVVDAMREFRPGGITSYMDWYKRDTSYTIEGTNPVREIDRRTTVGGWDRSKPDLDEREQQILSKEDSPLSAKEIRTYLKRYVVELKEKTWFKEAPHYFIVVKPISVPDGPEKQRYLPLANLFVHFGTAEKKDLEFYREVMSKLLIVWFRHQAYLIVRELGPARSIDAPADEHRPQFAQESGQLPKRLDRPLKTGSKLCLNSYYNAAFPDKGKGPYPDFSEHLVGLDTLVSKVPKEFAHDQRSLELVKWTVNWLDKNKSRTLATIGPIDKNALIPFLNLLNARRCALILLCVCNKDFAFVHRAALRRAENYKSDTTRKLEEHRRNQLWKDLFIPMVGFSIRVYNTASPREKELLDNLVQWLGPAASQPPAPALRKSDSVVE